MTEIKSLTGPDIADLLKGRDICYDDYGLIVHTGGGDCADRHFDGGDTSQREGWYWLGVWIRANTPGLQAWTPTRKLTFDQVLALMEPNGDGVFYRHPKQPPFNDPFDKRSGTSRDQLTPMIAAMGVYKKYDQLHRLWDALPEDLLGKHAFNGNWRNFLGQSGPDCTAIKRQDCSPVGDCSLQVDDRSCPLKTDARDCSLKTDNSDCSLQVDRRDCSLRQDTRSCGHDIEAWPIGRHHINDPICEASKSTQNGLYAAQKLQCETERAGQNSAYAGIKATCELNKASKNQSYAVEKGACEASKSSQNVFYAADKANCELAKSSQNAVYAANKGMCEAVKTAGKAGCEADKAARYQVCRISNVFSGDLMGPATVNLFRRALNENPFEFNPGDLRATIVQGGVAGDTELLINSYIRVSKSQSDRDDVGDDLNHIVELLMAELFYPSPISEEAVRVYTSQREPSYGSYLGEYYTRYGSDATDMRKRIDDGIASGWMPDASPIYGAVRWYHSPDKGANPQLATLYSVIIEKYFHK